MVAVQVHRFLIGNRKCNLSILWGRGEGKNNDVHISHDYGQIIN